MFLINLTHSTYCSFWNPFFLFWVYLVTCLWKTSHSRYQIVLIYNIWNPKWGVLFFLIVKQLKDVILDAVISLIVCKFPYYEITILLSWYLSINKKKLPRRKNIKIRQEVSGDDDILNYTQKFFTGIL